MANDTKERILAAALEMFSKNGYAGTNIRELSASLGLVKSGVYKHYESKEAIWNALLDQMIAYYADHFGSADHMPPVPDSLEAFRCMKTSPKSFERTPVLPLWHSSSLSDNPVAGNLRISVYYSSHVR